MTHGGKEGALEIGRLQGTITRFGKLDVVLLNFLGVGEDLLPGLHAHQFVPHPYRHQADEVLIRFTDLVL